MGRFVFPQWTEKFKRLVGLLVLGGPVYLVAIVLYGATPDAFEAGYQPDQPVPYSHALHAGQMGMDCRYCHDAVDRSDKAGVPPASTCMGCHASVLPDSEVLKPVREAFDTNKALAWTRVHDLPDYVYFSHRAHVVRGVGCESCHGRIDQMEKVYQTYALRMDWCLECHRNPDRHLRDPSRVTEMGYPYDDELENARRRRRDNDINPPTNCTTCHR
jgi:hypothetical protein